MRIGIDARPATEVTAGIGTYVRELLRELSTLVRAQDHELVLYAREAWGGLALHGRVGWVTISGSDAVWNIRTARHASHKCDVYLATSSYLTPWFLTVPSVVVVHDMVAFDRARLPHRQFARVERATIRPALRRARTVIAISESTRRDLVEKFPHTAPKTSVVLNAAQDRFTPTPGEDAHVTRKYDLTRPYVLAVGTLEPRKNLPRLIEAFALLPDDLRGQYDLVLVGARGWEAGETSRAVLQNASSVRTLGYVVDADLPALYRRATLFAFPSIYEGFGLPVLEAMQSGTAVLAGRTSSIPEVGGDAVRYVEPTSVDSIRDGLEHTLRSADERTRMVKVGLQRARQFSWARAAAATLRVLEQAPGDPKGRLRL